MTDQAGTEETMTAAEWRRREERQQRARDCYDACHAPDPLTMTFAGVPSPASCLCGRYIWTPEPARSATGGTPQ